MRALFAETMERAGQRGRRAAAAGEPGRVGSRRLTSGTPLQRSTDSTRPDEQLDAGHITAYLAIDLIARVASPL